MGVHGVIPLLSPCRERINLARAAQGKPGGVIVGQDAYVWMHEFTATQARRVVLDGDLEIIAQEMLLRCRRFLANGVTVLLVFDGKRQLAKAGTNDLRTKKRLKALAEVERLQGLDDDCDIDSTLLKVAAHVSEEMKLTVVKFLRKNGWPHYTIAPFEADGQLAKLMSDGDIDCVSTVDSDLLVLVQSGKVILRLNPAGWGDLYDMSEMQDLAQKALITGNGDESDTDSDSDDEAEAVPKRGTNTLRLSNMMMQLISKHGNAAIKYYGMIVRNDYNQFKGAGPSTALTVLANVEGALSLETVCASIAELRAAGSKRRRATSSNDTAQQERKISSTIQWGTGAELKGSLTKCLTMFEDQLVYDRKLVDFCTLSGKPDGGNVHINRASFDSIPRVRARRRSAKAAGRSHGGGSSSDDVDGNDDGGADDSHLKGPAGWAVGMYDGDNNDISSSMPKISQVPVVGCHVPVKLTPEMVIGAVLPKEIIKDNSVGELTRWLRCRGVSIPANKNNKAGLIEMVTVQTALEEAEPGMVAIYDPDCRSLSRRLLEGKIIPLWHNDLDGGDGPPDSDDPGWVPLSGMAERAPIITEAVLRDYFKDAGAHLDPNVRVLEEGYALIQSLSFLPNFRYHPGHDGRGTTVFFTMDVPATARSGVFYPVSIQCACLPPQGDELGRIMSITRAVCGGGSTDDMEDADNNEGEDEGANQTAKKKSKKKDDGSGGCKAKEWECIHKSALLQAIQNIARPKATGIDKRDLVPTSCMCRWNHPGSGDMASPDQPLECLCVRKPKRLLKRVGNRVCLSEGLSRKNFNAMAPAAFEKTKAAAVNPASEPKFLRALQELFDSAAADYGGRRCCAEVQWYGGDAGRDKLEG